jgi:glycosyltransferase involved in cell wall biosynthesis
MINLTIVIPSFNRTEILSKTLPVLLNQLNPEIKLVILDNFSDDPISLYIDPLVSDYPNLSIEIIRNSLNIGGDANILRSFELVNDGWLWILGDDDVVAHDAIDKIYNTISQNKDAAFINFSTLSMFNNKMRSNDFQSYGLSDFINKMDFAGNVNFMSVGVWNVERFRNHIQIAYRYSYSMATTFILLLSNLAENGKVYFSSQVLIKDVSLVSGKKKWNYIDFMHGWVMMLEIPMAGRLREELYLKIKKPWITPESVIIYFLIHAVYSSNSYFKYGIYVNRVWMHIPYFSRIRFTIYRLFFIHPKVSLFFLKSAVRLFVLLKIKNINIAEIIFRYE